MSSDQFIKIPIQYRVMSTHSLAGRANRWPRSEHGKSDVCFSIHTAPPANLENGMIKAELLRANKTAGKEGSHSTRKHSTQRKTPPSFLFVTMRCLQITTKNEGHQRDLCDAIIFYCYLLPARCFCRPSRHPNPAPR